VLVKQIGDIEMKSMGQSFWEDLWLQVLQNHHYWDNVLMKVDIHKIEIDMCSLGTKESLKCLGLGYNTPIVE
jgi:hypothetical protein